MKITTTQLRQIIREEIQKITLNEAKAFYTFFSGRQAIQGDSLSSVKNVTKDGMDPEDVQNIDRKSTRLNSSHAILKS